MAQSLTKKAFDLYRAGSSLQVMNLDVKRYDGDMDHLTAQDGLESWQDGSPAAIARPESCPVVDQRPAGMRLWVIIEQDVLHAVEQCAFGAAREAGIIKHSNLTGGLDAYSGGELSFLDKGILILNGSSGRYRVRSESEMRSVAVAFKESGYGVWSMGWSSDTNRPAIFGTQDPEWVP